ncbi:Glutamate--cysteine ligase [Lamellibrachia satsuma]|nr:Glutamate--cysteine ligase [Lamellibrachia satsuma]
MGLLSEGSPLSWEETKKYAQHVRHHGILQFINQFNKLKDRSNDCLRWGDEVEYMLTQLDHEAKTARLLLKGAPLLMQLQLQETSSPNDHPTTWRPEYAAYMIEGTPGKPYGHRMAHFNNVEANMKLR